jgi:hypothetical protein
MALEYAKFELKESISAPCVLTPVIVPPPTLAYLQWTLQKPSQVPNLEQTAEVLLNSICAKGMEVKVEIKKKESEEHQQQLKQEKSDENSKQEQESGILKKVRKSDKRYLITLTN